MAIFLIIAFTAGFLISWVTKETAVRWAWKYKAMDLAKQLEKSAAQHMELIREYGMLKATNSLWLRENERLKRKLAEYGVKIT